MLEREQTITAIKNEATQGLREVVDIELSLLWLVKLDLPIITDEKLGFGNVKLDADY